MSLKAKLILAFLAVALVALIPAAIMMNAGMYVMMTGRLGSGLHRGMMGGMMGSSFGPGPVEVQAPIDYLRMVRSWSIWSSLAALALAGGAGLFIAVRVTRPLGNLRDAAQHLDLRDLSRRVPVAGNDEIADLAASFNHMCDRLESEERARRGLVADVAHELRHPLAVLQGRLELMQDGKVELEPEALLPLQDEVIRLTRLVGDLRDLSLAEVGGLSLHLGPVDLATVLAGLLGNLEPVAATREVRLEAEVAPDLPAISADGDRIRQVLVNLVSNALQYTPPGGRVTVRAWQQDGELLVRVADTGPGIGPEDLAHIWDRFYRADKSRSRATGGTGLGLAIVRGLVTAHGGRVWAESVVGEGSVFTVALKGSERTAVAGERANR